MDVRRADRLKIKISVTAKRSEGDTSITSYIESVPESK